VLSEFSVVISLSVVCCIVLFRTCVGSVLSIYSYPSAFMISALLQNDEQGTKNGQDFISYKSDHLIYSIQLLIHSSALSLTLFNSYRAGK